MGVWSELSGFFGRGQLQSRLSLAISQLSLREEELRARQHSALCRLREEALWEKTQAELAWLEHRRRCLGKGEEGALADITRKQEEVVNRMRQEQAEIRHWRNLYRCGRQQRRVLLRQQKEVLDIRRSAARVMQDLQQEGEARAGQRWAGPAETHTSPGEGAGASPAQPRGRGQSMGGPKAMHPHPTQGHNPHLQLKGSEGEDPVQQLHAGHAPSPTRWPPHPRSPPTGGGQHHLWMFLEPKTKTSIQDHKQDTPQTDSRGQYLECSQVCPRVQQESKNPLHPVCNRAVEKRKALPRHQKDDHQQEGSYTSKQDLSRPNAKPSATVDTKASSKRPRDGGPGGEPLQDHLQNPEGMFLSKTDLGLRRLLSSDDVWTWGKRRTIPAEMAPVEEDIVTATQPSYPSSSPRHPQSKSAIPPPPETGLTEGRFRSQGESLNQRETMAMTPHKSQCDAQTDVMTERRAPKAPLLGLQEGSGSSERVSEEEDSSSAEDSSSSGGPLRVRSLPNSAEVSWKSQRSAGSFSSLPEFQRVAAVCVNISELSISSSDVEEDLPLDGEDRDWDMPDHDSLQSQGRLPGACSEVCTTPAVGGSGGCVTSNAATCNIQNNEWSPNALSSNNNCEIMPFSDVTQAGDLQGVSQLGSTGTGYQGAEEVVRTEALSPDAVSPVHDTMAPVTGSRETDSSSAEDSLSETEEKYEALSSCSEDLTSSEDDGADPHTAGTKASSLVCLGKHETAPPSHPCSPAPLGAKLQEENPLSPCTGAEFSQPPPEMQAQRRKCGTDKLEDFMSSWNPPAPEEALSEILSPVDEILSYGSAELPPPIAYDLHLPPPPPAFEVITWTSEEGFPPPPDDLGEPQNDGNPLEDPSIKSEELPSLSDDLLVPGNAGPPAAPTDRGALWKADLPAPGSQVKGHSLIEWLQEGRVKDSSEDAKSPLLAALSTAEEDGGSSEPLSSFRIGDHVLVCNSKPGRLRFKGTTAFASGYWAGVALDSPSGNHDGSFRGVRYFQCEKNCGVLVRAEDISHLPGEQDSDLETRVDDDPFSDEEPPSASKPRREGEEGGAGNRPERGSPKQAPPEEGSSTPKQTCRNSGFLQEPNNNPLQIPNGACEDVFICGVSSAPPCCGCEPDANAAQPLGGAESEDCTVRHTAVSDLQEILHPQDECCAEGLGGHKDASDLHADARGPATLSFLSLEQPAHSGEEKVTWSGWSDAHLQVTQVGTVGTIGRCGGDLESLVERLMGELLKEVVKEAEEVKRRRHGNRGSPQEDSHVPNSEQRRSEGSQTRASPLCFSDQWHCSLACVTQPKVRVQPHDPGVIHRLVGASVKALWGQRGGHVTIRDAPAYLVDEESRRAYRQLIFDLTSDIFHEMVKDRQKTGGSPWETKDQLSLSICSGKTSLRDIKVMIQTEVRRILNLDCTDAELRETLQKLCKYRTAHRDRVDYILIQELHKDEMQWVDYSLDQLHVKMQLTEEIFDILLQDTVSVLNKIYGAPSGVSPPSPQSSQLSLIP
ncbi:centrosome-associated protein 350 [Megalops cyprinoides]|uniref:centrosome-associated protein 350 n=1 Tax=Megalops cyprinoides TaxID=118141 RepID=UPI001863B634|nr:centrosome-associated protein 350 [Megalops cyprinoides]